MIWDTSWFDGGMWRATQKKMTGRAGEQEGRRAYVDRLSSLWEGSQRPRVLMGAW